MGRPHSSEYVIEYSISYGTNGYDYVEYKDPDGNIKVRYITIQKKKNLYILVHQMEPTLNINFYIFNNKYKRLPRALFSESIL